MSAEPAMPTAEPTAEPAAEPLMNPSALVLVDDERLNPLEPLKLHRTFSQDSQKADLRARCLELGLPITGNKAVLLDRINNPELHQKKRPATTGLASGGGKMPKKSNSAAPSPGPISPPPFCIPPMPSAEGTNYVTGPAPAFGQVKYYTYLTEDWDTASNVAKPGEDYMPNTNIFVTCPRQDDNGGFYSKTYMIPLPPDTRYKAGTPIEFLVAENTSTFLAYPYPTVVPAQPITPAVASDGELATTPPLPGPPLDPALVGASGSEEAGSGGSISTGDPSASRADGVVEPVVPPATAS